MRLSRLCPLLLLSLFLCAQAPLAANRSSGGHGLATGRLLAPARAAGQVVSEAFENLRALALASPLARENRLSPEEERRLHVSLWADLEAGGARLP